MQRMVALHWANLRPLGITYTRLALRLRLESHVVRLSPAAQAACEKGGKCMKVRWLSRTFAAVAVAAMVAAACSSGTPKSQGTSTASGKPVAGGKIVLGAEQYPECINPVTQCASASWLFWDTTIYLF